MERHRRTALRIGNMHIAHGGGDAAMPQNALHFRQMHAGLQQIGSAAMPKLMHTVDRHLGPLRDGVNPVADRLAAETLAGAAHQQSALAAASGLLQLVVAKRQIRIQAPQHHLRQRHTALASGLAAIDAQGSFAAIQDIEVQPLQLAATQACAVEQRQHRNPQIRTVVTVTVRRFAPHRFHVRVINPFRQATVGRDLRPLHPAQRVDLPQSQAHQVVTKAPHGAQRSRNGRFGAEARTTRHVARDQLGIDTLDANAWATPLQPSSPAV